MALRAIRGATQLDADDREQMLERVAEMVTEVMRANELVHDDVVSILFTATSDLRSEFPAFAARQLGFADTPLVDAWAMETPSSMPRVVRMLAHVETPLTKQQVKHVYLHGAARLRADLVEDGR